jgi:arylsulfatase A-like enzyme
MHGVFFAAGGRLATGKSISPVSILDLAPTLCQALGIQPLSGLEGSAIEGIWN